jgi:hypothetical protein
MKYGSAAIRAAGNRLDRICPKKKLLGQTSGRGELLGGVLGLMGLPRQTQTKKLSELPWKRALF